LSAGMWASCVMKKITGHCCSQTVPIPGPSQASLE
jgi:hypothetical protein